MADDSSVFERFVSLAKRELLADDIRLLTAGEAVPEAANVLVTRLNDGRHVLASFAAAPPDRDALERRLSMLVRTFEGALAEPPSEKMRTRPRAATSLHEELKALAARARAIDAVVIDTDSPVVWGCASVPARPQARTELLLRDVSDRELASRVDDESGPLQGVAAGAHQPESSVQLEDFAHSGSPASSPALAGAPDDNEATRRAIKVVRSLPALDGLHKGRHLRHVERSEGAYLLALSFSGIYLLCLVFDDEFDELRAERAAAESMPRIERLVFALPPLDPDPPQPMGGVVALRRRRR